MANAKRLPSGNWRVQLYAGTDKNGKRIYESITAPTKAEAELIAATRRVELDHEKLTQKYPTEQTVGEAIDVYIAERDGYLSPKTIRDYISYRRLYLQNLMRVKIKNLSEQQIQREINRESRRLSPLTVRNLWRLLHAALMQVNPSQTQRYYIRLPKPNRKETHIPNEEQLFALFEFARGTRMEIPVVLAATCGLRRGEIAALDLSADVDFAKNEIRVTKTYTNTPSGEWIIKSPKTKSGNRTIPAPEWVIDILRDAEKSGYQPPHPSTITSAFSRIREKLNLNIRFHDLRHYYASLMLALGIPDKYAMANMGHSTPDMLRNVYQHLIDAKKTEFSAQITGFLQSQYLSHAQSDVQHDFPRDGE